MKQMLYWTLAVPVTAMAAVLVLKLMQVTI